MWRNWKTQQVEGLPAARPCRFDPGPGHHRTHSRGWRNWQTRPVQTRLSLRVRVPFRAPPNKDSWQSGLLPRSRKPSGRVNPGTSVRIAHCPPLFSYLSSSVGRAAVSKTVGRGFESFLGCHQTTRLGRAVEGSGLQVRMRTAHVGSNPTAVSNFPARSSTG